MPLGAGSASQFHVFLVSGGREIPIYDAVKKGIVSIAQAERSADVDLTRYETDCAVLKLFMKDDMFGAKRFMYSFYILLSKSSVNKQEIVINPRVAQCRTAGYMFKTEGRFLKKSEAIRLFDPKSMQARMLKNMETPAVEILREIVAINRSEHVQREQAVRKIRMRRS